VNPRDENWLLIRDSWLDIPLGPDTGQPNPTWEVFSENFERHLQKASEYVSLHVSDRGTLERIVTRVVVTSPGLMNRQTGGRLDMPHLHASADRLIALEQNLSTSRKRPESMRVEPEHGRMRHRRSFVSGVRKARLVAGKEGELKERAIQAAEALLGDRALETGSAADRTTGKIKQSAERVVDTVMSILRRRWN
jgi:hypothetical protein